jgi:hypothetical protein
MITVVLLFSAPTSATICTRRNSSAAGFTELYRRAAIFEDDPGLVET